MAQGNVYPKAVQLSKGEYSVRLLLRHDNAAHLEKLTKTALLMDRALDDKVPEHRPPRGARRAGG